ncbi:MAG: cupin domain-containing protein [Chloroflexi bacterium]|nr:cupin domain-containing protein [Chloroflexota bacterium]
MTKGIPMPVKKISAVQPQVVKAGTKTTIQVLISPEEGPNFAMRRFVMQPGGSMPKHTNLVEHEQLVLNGRARIGIGDEVYEVEKDNVVFIPAGVPHWYQTIGDEPFEFLCMVPNKPDEVVILE